MNLILKLYFVPQAILYFNWGMEIKIKKSEIESDCKLQWKKGFSLSKHVDWIKCVFCLKKKQALQDVFLFEIYLMKRCSHATSFYLNVQDPTKHSIT